MKFSTTQQAIAWFRDRYQENTLELRPPFQRKPVWAAKQKSFLIESILLDLPVPEVYIQQLVGDKTTSYAVVDGQQRIRTILQFIGADRDESEQAFNKFSLDKLPADSLHKDKAYSELSDTERKDFLSYQIAVRMLVTDSEESVKDIFRRLNKFLTKLNDQELRNATYGGPFVSAVLELADDEYWIDNRLVSLAQVRRMKDVEFVSDLLIGVMHGPQGGAPKVLDEYYNQYEDYEDEFPGQKKAVKRFNTTLDLLKDALPDTADTRWENRTDFYSLFVAVAVLLRDKKLPTSKRVKFRKELTKFEQEVDLRLANQSHKTSAHVIKYVRAAEKGANDKKRRANRHAAILKVIEPLFVESAKGASA